MGGRVLQVIKTFKQTAAYPSAFPVKYQWQYDGKIPNYSYGIAGDLHPSSFEVYSNKLAVIILFVKLACPKS